MRKCQIPAFRNFKKKVLVKRLTNYICSRFRKGADSVAQLVEQYTFNVWVLGSSPSRVTE